MVPEVIAKGERTPKMRGKVKLAEYRFISLDGTRYTVVTEIKSKGEEFNDFYTNRKSTKSNPADAKGDTLDSAQTNDFNASSDAKLQQNSDSTKELSGKYVNIVFTMVLVLTLMLSTIRL
jgi:hypothetical protein